MADEGYTLQDTVFVVGLKIAIAIALLQNYEYETLSN